MSIVIAQKHFDLISFSADSLIIPFGQYQSNFGIKIFALPLRIYSTSYGKDHRRTVQYNHPIAMAITATHSNAFMVRESMYKLLRDLRFIPYFEVVSFEGVARVMFKLYKMAVEGLHWQQIPKEGACEVILSGYCPQKECLRTFVFFMDFVSDDFHPFYQEILFGDEILFYGRASNDAIEIYNKNKIQHSVRIVRELILSKKNPYVGGSVQYGCFDKYDFKAYGIVGFSIDAETKTFDKLYQISGVNLYREDPGCDMDTIFNYNPDMQPLKDELSKIIDYLSRNPGI